MAGTPAAGRNRRSLASVRRSRNAVAGGAASIIPARIRRQAAHASC